MTGILILKLLFEIQFTDFIFVNLSKNNIDYKILFTYFYI